MPTVNTLTEPRTDTEDLAAAAAAGDRDALGELYERYADDARRVAYLEVGDVETARDVTGEAWVRVGKGIHTYRTRQGSGFVGWLMAIVRNVAKDHFRKPFTRRERLTADMLLLDREASSADNPAETLERKEQARLIVEALGQLTRDQRQCLLLRFWCNLSLAETGQVMGRTGNAIGVLQDRALRAMERKLPAGVSDVGNDDRRPRRVRRVAAAEAAGEAGTRC